MVSIILKIEGYLLSGNKFLLHGYIPVYAVAALRLFCALYFLYPFKKG